jgi:hypothetical protein
MDGQRTNRQPIVATGAIEQHVTDMTATFSADVTLAQAQNELLQHQQWLPIDGDPALSLGRLVEMNSTGPLRLGYGAWRDLMLGCQFTNGRNELITAGGRAIKNVAGYDLTRFMVGQHGIFGKLVTLTTRTYHRPEFALLAEMSGPLEILNAMLTTPCRPQWAMLTSGKLFCGYLGDEQTIAFYESKLAAYAPARLTRQTLAQDIEFRNLHWLGNRAPTVFRASVPPTKVAQFIELIGSKFCSADPVFGIVVGSCGTEADIITQAAMQLGGSVAFDDPKQIETFFGAQGPQRAIFQSLQAAFQA